MKASLSGSATRKSGTSSGRDIRFTRPVIRPIVPSISGCPAWPIRYLPPLIGVALPLD